MPPSANTCDECGIRLELVGFLGFQIEICSTRIDIQSVKITCPIDLKTFFLVDTR